MTGFAVYSSDFDPKRLYVRGDPDGQDPRRVADVVRFGDRPLDLLVEVDEGRVLWSFRGQRRTTANRTGYFVADYGGDGNLFEGFERELRQLHETDEWTLPHAEELRWDTGFQLWRISPELPGLTPDERETLLGHLQSPNSRPLEFGMADYRSALQVLKAVHEHDVPCTVGVASGDTPGSIDDVDLLLRPGEFENFTPLSEAGTDVVDAEQLAAPGEHTNAATGGLRFRKPEDDGGRLETASRIAIPLLLVVLGFSAYSFISRQPVQPISGLGAIGGLLGAFLGFPGLAARFVASDETHPLNFPRRWWNALRQQRRPTLLAVTYGTLMGFLFPKIIWVLGGWEWPFGTLGEPLWSFLYIAFFVGVMSAIGSVIVVVHQFRDADGFPILGTVVDIVYGHAVYAFFLFAMTGLAVRLWYRVIPSAT